MPALLISANVQLSGSYLLFITIFIANISPAKVLIFCPIIGSIHVGYFEIAIFVHSFLCLSILHSLFDVHYVGF